MSRPTPETRWAAIAAVAIGFLAAHAAGLAAALLPALPLLALLASLLLGFYPGCETALRLGDRLEGRERRRPSAPPAWRRPRLALHAPRGGLLLALSLSGRAPPA